jgi:hypothetical protein
MNDSILLREDYDRVEVCYVLFILVIEESLYEKILVLVYVTKNAMCCSFLVIEESLYPLIMRRF